MKLLPSRVHSPGFCLQCKNTADLPVSQGPGNQHLWAQMNTLAFPSLDNLLYPPLNIPLWFTQQWHPSLPASLSPTHTHMCAHTHTHTHTPAGTNFNSHLNPHIYAVTHHIHSFHYSYAGNSHSTCFLNPKLLSLTPAVLYFSWLLILWLQTATCLPHPVSSTWAGCPVRNQSS